MRKKIVDEICVFAIVCIQPVLFVFLLISCAVGQQKRETKMEKAGEKLTVTRQNVFQFTAWQEDGFLTTESGWVVEDVGPSTFDARNITPSSFLYEDEWVIDGQEMRRRAVIYHGNLGLADAEYLGKHNADIPAIFWGHYIVFPGTVLQSSFHDQLYVPVLIPYGNRDGWSLYFTRLDKNWNADWLLVNIKQ